MIHFSQFHRKYTKNAALSGIFDKTRCTPAAERTTRFLILPEWLRVTEAGIRPSADSDCNELITAGPGQRFVGMLAVWL